MAHYPGTLESANVNEFGIVYANQIQGHKTVDSLDNLYLIPDAILSKSKTNSGNDAIGQEWYVVSEGCYYRLDNWENRKEESGWTKLQIIDKEFDSLESHGADKIKNFTTTDSTVVLNYNTWKNSETSSDGSATIPAATGTNAGVLTADGKDQLDQLNKIGEVTHLSDSEVFTTDSTKVTIHYNCIDTKGGATSEVQTKSADIPEATLSNAGVLGSDQRNQLEQLNKISRVSNIDFDRSGGVIEMSDTTGTIYYNSIDITPGANSEVLKDKTIVIPSSTRTEAGLISASDKVKLDGLNTNNLSGISVTSDDTKATFTITKDNGISEDTSSTFDFPSATVNKSGTITAADKIAITNIEAMPAVTHIKEDTTFTRESSDVKLNFESVNPNLGGDNLEKIVEYSIPIGAATSSLAGVMTSTDKTELDRINTANFELGDVTPDDSTLSIAATKTIISTGSSSDNNITLPAATTSLAGVMTSADKVKLDTTLPNLISEEENRATQKENSINSDLQAFKATKAQKNGLASLDSSGKVPSSQLPSYVDDVIEVYATYETSPTGDISNVNLYSDSSHQSPITGESGKIYVNITPDEPNYNFRWSGTSFLYIDTGGLILGEITGTAYDGGKGKNTTDEVNSLIGHGASHFESVSQGASDVKINFKCWFGKSNDQSHSATIPTSTSTLSGLMSPADKVKLDTTLPNQITSNKNTIDNYTVNGFKISTSPVLDGADIKMTGYSKPTSTSAIATTDSINSSIGKLEKKADDHIANKSNPHGVTKSQVGLGNVDNTSDEDKPISTATQSALNSKVGSVTISGTGNAVTSASISGTVLTLTKGATYNNYSHPAGSAASKTSGFYKFSTDSTSHINAVTAVTKADITALGIPGTNTTYSAGSNLALSGTTFSLASTISVTRVNASSGFYQTSDERLKSEIKDLNYTLDDICSIPTVSFVKNGEKEIGTIAQGVEDKFSELVSETSINIADIPNPEKFTKVEGPDGESYVLVKEVDYSKLSILAIDGIKLLREEINKLRDDINKLSK